MKLEIKNGEVFMDGKLTKKTMEQGLRMIQKIQRGKADILYQALKRIAKRTDADDIFETDQQIAENALTEYQSKQSKNINL